MKLTLQLCSLLIILSLVYPLSTVYAQVSGDIETENPLTANSRSLQFGIGENFSLNSFTGTAFSYKRHTAQNQANRIGFSLNNSLQSAGDPDVDNSDNVNTLLSLNATYTWMHYLNSETEVKPYFGYGPGLSFSYNKQNPPGDDNSITNTGLGLSGVAYTGVEWFFHRSLSLHAEYGVSLSFTRLSVTRDAANDTSETLLRLGSNGVMFGISAYF